MDASVPLADVLASDKAGHRILQNVINELAETATGSASRIARMCLLAEPPTIDRGEVTDKGSINQRAVLTHRAQTVAHLHDDTLHTILKPRVR
jgi:feruloyl-CoA synthase